MGMAHIGSYCLNAWSPFSGTVCEGIGDVALLEEMCCWR